MFHAEQQQFAYFFTNAKWNEESEEGIKEKVITRGRKYICILYENRWGSKLEEIL